MNRDRKQAAGDVSQWTENTRPGDNRHGTWKNIQKTWGSGHGTQDKGDGDKKHQPVNGDRGQLTADRAHGPEDMGPEYQGQETMVRDQRPWYMGERRQRAADKRQRT